LRNSSTASTILDVNYGIDVYNEDDPIIDMMVNGMKHILEILPLKGSIADSFPFREQARVVNIRSLLILFWTVRHLPGFIPGARLYKVAADLKEYVENIYAKPYTLAKEQLVSTDIHYYACVC
jgi:hypothetical protein